MTISIFNIIGFYFCEHRYATISFFLCTEPIIVEAEVGKLFMVYIVFMRFCFLQTEHIRLMAFEPLQHDREALAQRVDVEGGDFHTAGILAEPTRRNN